MELQVENLSLKIRKTLTFTFPSVAYWLQHFGGCETTIMKSAQVNASLHDAMVPKQQYT